MTNDTVITVVAVEDCTAAVTNTPVSIPVRRFVVMACNTWRSCEPAIFCRLSLIDFIPYINKASEPINLKIIQIDIFNVIVMSLIADVCVYFLKFTLVNDIMITKP